MVRNNLINHIFTIMASTAIKVLFEFSY